MPKVSTKIPDSATIVTTYAEIESLISAFSGGHMSLLVILGPPGISKSQSIHAATRASSACVIKGRSTPADFYCKLFEYLDCPIVLDDADDLFANKLTKSFIKILTETDQYKRVDYGTTSHVLKEREVPPFFHTKSACCIISNSWDADDSVCQAIESRAEFIYFRPNWGEVYKQVAKWFWDQEIFDYVRERIPVLRSPDMRLFVKAFNRKNASKNGGIRGLSWKAIIDDYIDDEDNLAIRKIMDDKSLPTPSLKIKAYERLGGSRATYYRRVAAIESYRVEKPKRILLKRTKPVIQQRPLNPIA